MEAGFMPAFVFNDLIEIIRRYNNAVKPYSLPTDRLYHMEYNLWLQHSGERVRIGMIEPAADIAGRFIDFVPRALGRTVYKGRTLGTLESDVWVGPLKAPCGGQIIDINEVLCDRPSMINESPYDQGWLMILRPIDWGLDQLDLHSAAEAQEILDAGPLAHHK